MGFCWEMDLHNQTVVINFTKRVEDNARDAIMLNTTSELSDLHSFLSAFHRTREVFPIQRNHGPPRESKRIVTARKSEILFLSSSLTFVRGGR